MSDDSVSWMHKPPPPAKPRPGEPLFTLTRDGHDIDRAEAR